MAVQGGFEIVFSQYRYPQLPADVRPWKANGSVTGDATGGAATIPFDFTPGATRSFTGFLTITRCVVQDTVVNDGNSWIAQANASSWEDSIGGVGAFGPTLVPVTTGAVLDLAQASSTQLWYPGRIATGQTGRITWFTDNVDTKASFLQMSGLLSDNPIIPMNDWRF